MEYMLSRGSGSKTSHKRKLLSHDCISNNDIVNNSCFLEAKNKISYKIKTVYQGSLKILIKVEKVSLKLTTDDCI